MHITLAWQKIKTAIQKSTETHFKFLMNLALSLVINITC